MMSVYHPIIRFKEKTNFDFELTVSHFDADSGEVDSYLTMEPVYTENFDGGLRNDFGAKYTDVARPVVTFIESDGSNLTPYKVRNVLRWLTGSKDISFMDICNDEGVSVCAYIGRFTDVKLHKIDFFDSLTLFLIDRRLQKFLSLQEKLYPHSLRHLLKDDSLSFYKRPLSLLL